METTIMMNHINDPIPASRPLLIFNHNPKAGGGSILKVLRGFKPHEIHCHKSASKAESYGSGCKSSNWIKAIVDDETIDKSFLHMQEFARTTYMDRLQGFVIGSIREPCSQYLSLWSWGSLGNGAFRKEVVTNPDLYGVSPPYFNTTLDKNRFLDWMRDPSVVGIVGDRVKASYGDTVLERVDCWVFVEDFQKTLLGCLRMYQNQGGFVDWEAPTVAALLEKEDNEYDNNHHKMKRRKMPPAKKDDPLGDPRSRHHGKCENMFDETTANQVEERTESFVYELFGYKRCCKAGTNFYPRQAGIDDDDDNDDDDDDDDDDSGNAERPSSSSNQKAAATATKEQQLVVSSVHSVHGSNELQKNNETAMISSKALASEFDHGWESYTSTKVVALATMAVILLLSFCRFICKPRRGVIR